MDFRALNASNLATGTIWTFWASSYQANCTYLNGTRKRNQDNFHSPRNILLKQCFQSIKVLLNLQWTIPKTIAVNKPALDTSRLYSGVLIVVPPHALLSVSVPSSTLSFLAMYSGLPDCTTYFTQNLFKFFSKWKNQLRCWFLWFWVPQLWLYLTYYPLCLTLYQFS